MLGGPFIPAHPIFSADSLLIHCHLYINVFIEAVRKNNHLAPSSTNYENFRRLENLRVFFGRGPIENSIIKISMHNAFEHT